jgi:hypothetical protein
MELSHGFPASSSQRTLHSEVLAPVRGPAVQHRASLRRGVNSRQVPDVVRDQPLPPAAALDGQAAVSGPCPGVSRYLSVWVSVLSRECRAPCSSVSGLCMKETLAAAGRRVVCEQVCVYPCVSVAKGRGGSSTRRCPASPTGSTQGLQRLAWLVRSPRGDAASSRRARPRERRCDHHSTLEGCSGGQATPAAARGRHDPLTTVARVLRSTTHGVAAHASPRPPGMRTLSPGAGAIPRGVRSRAGACSSMATACCARCHGGVASSDRATAGTPTDAGCPQQVHVRNGSLARLCLC